MREDPNDFQRTFDENVDDDMEATDDELRGVAYTTVFLLAFLACMLAAIFFLVW